MIKLTEREYKKVVEIRNKLIDIFNLIDDVQETSDDFYVDEYLHEGLAEFDVYIDDLIYNYKHDKK